MNAAALPSRTVKLPGRPAHPRGQPETRGGVMQPASQERDADEQVLVGRPAQQPLAAED
jgi:hypothetical protein